MVLPEMDRSLLKNDMMIIFSGNISSFRIFSGYLQFFKSYLQCWPNFDMILWIFLLEILSNPARETKIRFLGDLIIRCRQVGMGVEWLIWISKHRINYLISNLFLKTKIFHSTLRPITIDHASASYKVVWFKLAIILKLRKSRNLPQGWHS